jgi:hypothetical protein
LHCLSLSEVKSDSLPCIVCRHSRAARTPDVQNNDITRECQDLEIQTGNTQASHPPGTHPHPHTHAHMHACMHAWTHAHTLTYTHTHIHTQTPARIEKRGRGGGRREVGRHEERDRDRGRRRRRADPQTINFSTLKITTNPSFYRVNKSRTSDHCGRSGATHCLRHRSRFCANRINPRAEELSSSPPRGNTLSQNPYQHLILTTQKVCILIGSLGQLAIGASTAASVPNAESVC